MSKETQLISKISAKSVCGKIVKPTKREMLYTVYGIASGVGAGETNFGAWECLTGQFEAVNAATGDVYQSGRCFLPRTAHDLVAGQLKGLGTDDGAAVRFALQIGIEPAETTVGYQYTITPVLKPVEDDAMADLRKVALTAPEHRPALQHAGKAK